jgi:TP901 family phage tail tape measure protein
VATTVAVLRAVLGLDDQGFKRSASAAERSFDELGRRATKAGQAMTIGVTAPLVLLGKKAVDLAASFEQSMNVLQATSSASATEMKSLSDKARQLGADITLPGTSANDAAQAMLELSKAGLTVKDTMDAARSTLQLSAAAQVDNARAAEIVGDALNAFQLKGTQAGLVADLLAGAANASTGSIDQMASALSQSSASFVEMGVSVTDAVTAISLMAKAGIKGQDAGTSLKTALMRLNPTTKEAKAVMDRLKISFFDANGQFVGMKQSAIILDKAIGGLSQQNKQLALNLIGGSDAMRALSILARGGGQAFDEMKEKVSAAGQAADLAGAQNKGLKGALDALQSTIETALEAAVSPFLGDLTNLAKKAAEVAGKFNELDATTRKVIVFSAAGLAMVGPALLGIGQLIAAVRTMIPVFAAARTAAITMWAGITGPVGIVVAILVGAVALIAAAWINNWGSIREVTAVTLEFIVTTVTEFINGFVQRWEGFIDIIHGRWAEGWQKIKDGTVQQLQSMSTAMAKAADLDVSMTVDRLQDKKKAEDKAAADAKARNEKALADMKANAAKIKAAAASISSGPKMGKHDPNLFAGIGKRAKTPKESPLQQQTKAFKLASMETRLELKMLERGASDTSIQVAKQFGLMSSAQQKELVTRMTAIQARKTERQEMERVQESARKLRQQQLEMSQTTALGRIAVKVFGKELEDLNPTQMKMVQITAASQAAVDKYTNAEKARKEAVERSKKIIEQINGINQEAAMKLDLLRDGTEENKLSWQKFGKAFRDLSSEDSRKSIQTLADATRKEKENEKATEAATDAQKRQDDLWKDLAKTRQDAVRDLDLLRNKSEENKLAWDKFGTSIETLDFFTQAYLMSIGQVIRDTERQKNSVTLADQASKDWAESMASIGEKQNELRQEMDLLNDSSVENKLAWELMGTSIADLDAEFVNLIFDLGEVQRQIDATTAKKEVIADLAQQTQDVWMDAFGRLDEGFSGFFDGIISGFDKMLQDMAFKWLSAQVTKLIFGALGADTSGISGGPLDTLFGGGKAMGGNMDAGRAYMVGERGAELVFPDRNAAVISNSDIRRAMGQGGGGVTVVQNIQTPDATSFSKSRSTTRADALALAEVARRRNGG